MKDMITEGLLAVGGSADPVFSSKCIRSILVSIAARLKEEYINPEDIFRSTKPKERPKAKVKENTSLADLTRAVLHCSPDSLAPAFLYRGLIFYSLEEFKSALNNFEEAVNCNFSGKDEYKLHHKMAQCCLKMKKYSQSKVHLKMAIDKIKCAKISEKQKKEYSKILEESLKKISKKDDSSHRTTDLILQHHRQDKRLSSLVGVKQSPGKGRFCVAAGDITAGTVVFQDEGISPFLNPDDKAKTLDYCLMCLKPVGNNPFPCYTCNSVVYCSPYCRTLSAGSYHKYTCQIGSSGLRSGDRKDWFKVLSSLNILLSQPFMFWTSLSQTLLHRNTTEERRSVEVGLEREEPEHISTDLERYIHLFNMVTHEDRIPQSTRAKHAVITVFILRCVRRCDYIGKCSNPTAPFSEDELLLGELIYKLRLVSESNCYPLWGVEVDKQGQVGLENIGSGIYPSIGSYINSNCDPNTLRCNIGNSVIIIAARDIKQGEEITDNYCIHFSELGTAHRRDWLEENFFFNCECTACTSGWGTYDELDSKVPSSLQKLLIPLEMKNQESLRRGDVESALRAHEEELRLIEQHLAAPHQLFVSLRNSYQCCWWTHISNLIKDM